MATKTYHQVRAETIRLLIAHGALPSTYVTKAVGVHSLTTYFYPKERDPEDYLPEVVKVESYRRIHILALRNWHELYSEREREAQLLTCYQMIDEIAAKQNKQIGQGNKAAKSRNSCPVSIGRASPPSLLTLLEEFRNARLSS